MINLNEVYDSAAIAVYTKNDKSNSIPDLGLAFWPNKRKTSIDLKWIKTANGPPGDIGSPNLSFQNPAHAKTPFRQSSLSFHVLDVPFDEWALCPSAPIWL